MLDSLPMALCRIRDIFALYTGREPSFSNTCVVPVRTPYACYGLVLQIDESELDVACKIVGRYTRVTSQVTTSGSIDAEVQYTFTQAGAAYSSLIIGVFIPRGGGTKYGSTTVAYMGAHGVPFQVPRRGLFCQLRCSVNLKTFQMTDLRRIFRSHRVGVIHHPQTDVELCVRNRQVSIEFSLRRKRFWVCGNFGEISFQCATSFAS